MSVTGYVEPLGVAADLAALATAIEAEDGITSADVVRDLPEAGFAREAIKVVSAGENEVATISDGDSTSGAGTIDVDGGNAAWAYDDNAAAVKSAIEGLAEVSTTVTVTGTGSVADPFVITFADFGPHTVGVTAGTLSETPTYAQTNVGVADEDSLDAAVAAMTGYAGQALKFQFHLNGATSGNVDVSIGGQTASIAYDDADSDVDTAITALSTVTACTVSGSGTAADPFVVTITEVGDKGDVSIANDDADALPELSVHQVGKDAIPGAVLLSGYTPA